MLLKQKTEYSRYYGDFRGVDFSNDHTLVADGRFPYAVNMYKDYASGLGQGIETIPGFRRRFTAPNGGRIYGIHTVKIDGTRKVLVHAGTALYDWASYGEDESVSAQKSTALFEEMNAHDSVSFIFNNRLYLIDGKNYLVYNGETVATVKDDAYVPTTYINIIPAGENADIGTEYEQRNMLSPCFKHTFIATTYMDPEGNEIGATEFLMNESFDEITEVKVYGKNGKKIDPMPDAPTETADAAQDGETAEDTEIPEEELPPEDEPLYTVDYENHKVIFTKAPPLPEEAGYPELYAGIEITAKKTVYEAKDVKIKNADGSYITLAAYRGDLSPFDDFISMVESATITTVFDNRIFFSGIKGKPNLILYCGRNGTGFTDPSYIGVLNYMEDGVGTTPITAMLPVANTLLVLKNDTEQDGSVYYHTPSETGIDILPKIYPAEAGLAGTGCVGAACNFLDDPVFVSRLGLEAIGQLSVRYERAREHRSSMVDAKLVNLAGLSEAKLAEWNGYLVLLVDGKIFLADSRQVFTGTTGTPEYEWYYLEEIGIYENQRERHTYVAEWPRRFCEVSEIPNARGVPEIAEHRRLISVQYNGKTYEAKLIKDVVPSVSSYEVGDLPIVRGSVEIGGKEYEYDVAMYTKDETQYAFLCDTEGEMVGGDFSPAVCLRTFNEGSVENLFFGTANGVVCSFNFDKRQSDGFINPMHYTFDGRGIYCGCALKMDNCGIPHMTKTTVKRSTVIKAKSFASTAAKVRVRTNKNPYHEIARINSTRFSFEQMNFSDFSFVTSEETLFSVKEKEKKWVEKQYYIYSDEYKKPFSLFYVAHKYFVSGKYKGE